jgi:hypothetical protein
MPKSRGGPTQRAMQPTQKSQPQKSLPTPPTPPTSPPKTLAAASSVYTSRSILGKIARRISSTIPPFLTWAAVVLTLASGIIVFFPRLTVDPSGPYDPLNPSPITFTIANTNIVPLRDVHLGIGVCYIGEDDPNRPPPPHCNGPITISIIWHPQWFLRWLDSDEKDQIAIEDVLKRREPAKQFEDADITIIIQYTPWQFPSVWPFRRERQFRFITTRRSDGKIHWIPVPLNR